MSTPPKKRDTAKGPTIKRPPLPPTRSALTKRPPSEPRIVQQSQRATDEGDPENTQGVDDITQGVQTISIGSENGKSAEVESIEAQTPVKEEEQRRQYYIHFDLRNVGEYGGRTGSLINKYMLRRGFYDPRRSTGFIDDVLDEGQSLTRAPMRNLRLLAQVSRFYYEFWCVRNTFDADDLVSFLRRNIHWHITVAMYKIIDNEIERYTIDF